MTERSERRELAEWNSLISRAPAISDDRASPRARACPGFFRQNMHEICTNGRVGNAGHPKTDPDPPKTDPDSDSDPDSDPDSDSDPGSGS